MSDPIIRTGDIDQLVQAVSTLSKSVVSLSSTASELGRQHKILSEANQKLHDRIRVLEGDSDD